MPVVALDASNPSMRFVIFSSPVFVPCAGAQGGSLLTLKNWVGNPPDADAGIRLGRNLRPQDICIIAAPLIKMGFFDADF